jgi:hypothetical protein
MAAAKLLLKWRKECGEETPEYDLRRDIITKNLFGVDIMEGYTLLSLSLYAWSAKIPELEE